jgi:hypothetical protein
MDDKDIDPSDIPKTTDWAAAEVGSFLRPVKNEARHPARCRGVGLAQTPQPALLDVTILCPISEGDF